MPIYEYLCADCGKRSEILLTRTDQTPICQSCKSSNLSKMLSASSSLTGSSSGMYPGPGDTACCGSDPGHAGCAGPGSCCGKPH